MKSSFLARFTPSLMSAEALEAIFVQREPLAQDIVERIRDSALTKAKHHILLIGPRGIGKTHLVALVYHRIKALPKVEAALRIAWLREEEWGITSFRDLVMRVLRALQGEYGEACLEEKIEAIYKMASADEAERAAVALLKEFVGGKTLLVLMENLDDIFQGLGDEGQQQFRAFLQNHGGTAVFATSQSLFNGVSLRTSPFYGFFNIQHLPTFSLDEATRLLTKVAEHEQDEPLVNFLQTPKGRARVRAVHHLAGGNPRVYLIFSQFLTREALDALVEPFMQMLDDLTPYYQARMAWLSPQQRKIVEFLIENRGAAPVKAIADRTFTTPQTASSQLKTLRDLGYVRSESLGRESYYELREPLMRLAIEVKKHRGQPIRLLIDFLRLWYTKDELEQRLTIIDPAAILERAYVQLALELMQSDNSDPRVEACERDYKLSMEKEDFEGALKITDELIEIRGSIVDWLWRSSALHNLEKYAEAMTMIEKAERLIPEDSALEVAIFDLWICVLKTTIKMKKQTTEEVFQEEDHFEIEYAIEDLGERVLTIIKIVETELENAEASEELLLLTAVLIATSIIYLKKKDIYYIKKLIQNYQLSSVFAAAFVGTLPINLVDTAEAKKTKQSLQQISGGQEEFQLPLRLLDTAIRYRETEDQRVLLELPIEERQILEQMLKLEPADQTA